MKETMSLLHSEWLKIRSTKAFKVSMAFMLFLVPAVSWLEGRQYLSIGLDSTPETVPGLAEAIDPRARSARPSGRRPHHPHRPQQGRLNGMTLHSFRRP